ncbi:hypothetical protein [Paracoccus tibetensis]|uniref:Uncharacterized protein n=1 Tax=Paracoccus tibetensis TaxID=336292 RepID=A0A1G5K8B9_9RHOB|nr:hypothetical protein [Paracoccus tibetensis]SCY96902.1 hypothetical protein SAMN05660710_03781 [Paracoccus tibetensis]
MHWNDKVLDNLEQIYWSPDKIGLKPIKRQPTPDGAGFFVPKERLAGGKSLYSRGQAYAEWRPTIIKKEELLNQVLEIALAIAPSSFVADVFFAPLDICPAGRIRTLGREVGARHSKFAPRQFTQHDGLYVSDNAIVMMEMKLKARTSIEQYLKYCTLAALEEMVSGRKDHVGMIYLVPSGAVLRTRKDLRLDNPEAMEQIWNDPSEFTDKSLLSQLLTHHLEQIRNVGERLVLQIITWDDFLRAMLQTRDDAAATGNETLENLMQGMIAQIQATPDCGLRYGDTTT